MITVIAWAAPFLALAACGACVAGTERIRTAIVRARWAWRCRPRWRYRGRPPLPARDDDPLDLGEIRVLVTIVLGWDRPAPHERSRT